MVSKAVKLQDFLLGKRDDRGVEIMVEIVQKRPEDPLMMADRLDEIAAEGRVARDKAEKRFYDLLARAEVGDNVRGRQVIMTIVIAHKLLYFERTMRTTF